MPQTAVALLGKVVSVAVAALIHFGYIMFIIASKLVDKAD